GEHPCLPDRVRGSRERRDQPLRRRRNRPGHPAAPPARGDLVRRRARALL
ncbi:MAG: hypothetical protein AVDCRST_MAG47-2888, partial [uncultured Nocardioidaceae bacterium]